MVDKLPVYASFTVAWLSFLLYIPAFLVQADAGNPYSWMPRPVLSDLISLMTLAWPSFLRVEVIVALFILAAVTGLFFSRSPRTAPHAAPARDDRHLLCLALVFLGLPIAGWLASHLGRPIFFPRYLAPSALG